LYVIGKSELVLGVLIELTGMTVVQHATKLLIVLLWKSSKIFLRIRKNLKEGSVLGEYGTVAIHREMSLQKSPVVPSIRTINLSLQRHGCFDSRYRVRRESPPRGWYLPEVVLGKVELDSFDYVEDLRLEGEYGFVQLFNGISLHGYLVCSFPFPRMTAENTALALSEHWQQFGIHSFAQFDNSTVFTGSVCKKCFEFECIFFRVFILLRYWFFRR
jgi:hypothetical protein